MVGVDATKGMGTHGLASEDTPLIPHLRKKDAMLEATGWSGPHTPCVVSGWIHPRTWPLPSTRYL
jgi:hypothetical protein